MFECCENFPLIDEEVVEDQNSLPQHRVEEIRTKTKKALMNDFADLQLAIEEADFSKTDKIVHDIKGGLSILGCKRAAHFVSHFQEIYKKQDRTQEQKQDELEEWCSKLYKEIDRGMQELAKYWK